MGPVVLFGHAADQLIGFARDAGGLRQRGIFWQPNVHVGDIEVVPWEKLMMKTRREESTKDERQRRGGQDSPTMIDGKRDRPFVQLPKSTLAWPIGQPVSTRFQDVIRQQR